MKRKMVILGILLLWNIAFYYAAYPEMIKGEADIDFQVADTVAATMFSNQRLMAKYNRIELHLQKVEEDLRQKILENPDSAELWEQLLEVETLGLRTESEKNRDLAANWQKVADWILEAKKTKWGASATYDYKSRLRHSIEQLKKQYDVLENPAALANQIAHLQVSMKKWIHSGTDMGPEVYDSLYIYATLEAEAYRMAALQAEQSIPLVSALIGQKRLAKVTLVMRKIATWRDLIKKLDEETKSSYWSPDSVIRRLRED